MSEHMRELKDADVQDSLTDSSGILLFYKKVCPFCKALEVVLEKFNRSRPDIPLMHVDFESESMLVKKFQVERAPSLFILKNGKIVAQKVGLLNLKELTAMFEAVL
ncbi:MAG: thioredoxin family protein [SAR324 cluster bacterium]|nr:thioredoxin family protein [SAR324 cluster bacterium]